MEQFKIPFYSSLIFRSLISILLLMSVILSAAGYLSIKKLKSDALLDMQSDIHDISHITSEALSLPLWNLDKNQISKQLESLKSYDNFCGARVADLEGVSFVEVDFPATISKDVIIDVHEIFFVNPNLDPPKKEIIGTLEICASKLAVENKIKEEITRQLLFMIVILLAVISACYVSLLIIMRPLILFRQKMAKLSETMQPITDKSLLKRNEIGSLTASFNSMVADISRSYQEVIAAKDKAEKADAAKSDFLANMTHELRTPLNSVIGMTNLLLEREHPDEEREMLSVVHQASTILLEIVNDILDLSKIEAEEITLEKIGFDVGATVRKSIMTFRHLAEQKNLHLDCVIERNLPYLLGDPFRLSQIVNNLVSNAIKYTDIGHVTVTIGGKIMPDERFYLQCQVSDSGIGIPQEKISQMFQKFMQVDASNTRRYGGTGLGLAIVKHLVELMNGRIGLESEIGKGSVFWFNIPFEISETLGETTRSSLGKRRAESTGELSPLQAKILVAEDHPLNQAFIKLLLAKYNFANVDLKENGRAALDAIANKNYDLVLMDCFMPEMNGFETTKAIRASEQQAENGKHLPIVAMTANAMLGDEQKCLAAGMDDYIAKPIMENEFIEVLSRWIKFDIAVPEKKPEQNKLSESIKLIDLGIMKSFSEGDPDIEKQLVGLFIAQSDINIEKLETSSLEIDCYNWIEAAHSLKGGAGGIGADKLRKLCEKAQMMENSTIKERQETLTEIKENYQQVKNYLHELGY